MAFCRIYWPHPTPKMFNFRRSYSCGKPLMSWKRSEFGYTREERYTKVIYYYYYYSRRHKIMLSAPVDALLLPVKKKYKKIVVNKLLGIIQLTYTFLESLGCVLVRQIIHRVILHTFLCRNSKAGTIQTEQQQKQVLFYRLLGSQWWKWRCHYRCHSSPPRDLLTQTPRQNQQCSFQNHCQKISRSEPSFSTNSTASLVE